MKALVVISMIVLSALAVMGGPAPHAPVGVVSDWTNHHVLYPNSNDPAVMARIWTDPRWAQNWHLHHPETWWHGRKRGRVGNGKGSHRDWNLSLFTTTPTLGFGPLFDYAFNLSPQTGYGSLNTIDNGNGQFLATAGSLTVTGGADTGTYPLYAGGPGVVTSPQGAFIYNNLLYPLSNPSLDVDGLLFTSTTMEINIWGNSPGNYSYYDHTSAGYGTQLAEAGTFTPNVDPGGGQTFPAKFVFDVTAAPSCTNDYVVMGIPANAKSGGQANIVGVNNLYSSTTTGHCPGSGPNVVFAYATGTGEVPAAVTISMDGTQIAYVENLLTGKSYFHVLTLGTSGNNGTSATAAVVPGTGNNTVDKSVLLSPDGGVTNQSSTNTVFVNYDAGVAYATTHSWARGGFGYLYKINNVFSGSATPTIVWSVPIDAVPSAPVYDYVSNKVFFTDSMGRIDYVTEDSGGTPSVVYGAVVATGTTSENPVTIDSTHQMVYASFNSNGTNAIVVQARSDLTNPVTVPVGTANTTYTGPYGVDFNNAWYTGSGTPLMYVAGTGSGTTPTLYSVGFNASGEMNSSTNASAPLATGMADASPLTEFYNSSFSKDYLFVGVSNNCMATTAGGILGCVMALDISSGFPTINAGTTALGALGGTTGIIVDNNSIVPQASSIYYVTETGGALVKSTQSGLN